MRQKRLWLILGVAAVVVGVAWYFIFIRPIPSDEEMLRHFYAHRAEMQALVDSYRSYEWRSQQTSNWEDLPAVKRLMERSGISRVSVSAGMWLANPYSKEAGERLMELARAGALGPELTRTNGTLVSCGEFQATVLLWFVLTCRGKND
ncbi:MAG TPA: hypothetical protein VFA81_08835 [Burkholderiales bacterium]|nr:hypothetical protein [Burkholderiales bacterium]